MPYILHSTGLVATWIFDRTHHTLFDCGEGVSGRLRRRIFAIERVLLSHGHLDHVAGLFSLIASRASMKGDNEKPLDIYFPAGDRNVKAIAACLAQVLPTLPYRLSWHELSAGDALPLTEKRSIECFATKHVPRMRTLGFRITEQRHRLKAEFRAEPEIEKRMRQMTPEERDAAREVYRHILMAYSGDAMP
ncbi:MAG: MBL fold metallo-hydrolase, partial [Opitutales bacterium]